MPIYEYQCPKCDHRFEILQQMGAGSQELSCPNCSCHTLDKQFSTFSSSITDHIPKAPAGAGGCGTGRFT
ncbi:MAG TPA: zinc ribbon domain-containing protein [Acidobacteria bacterium]|nr:zinc ribbon domain-containing protein [Acidobacteriota bacterium]HIN70734.1 zinc ribbon domain-containing protein [Acidobacteriota bacterium]